MGEVLWTLVGSMSNKEKEQELREQLEAAMEEGEEIERIKQLLRSKLVQSGWRDEVKTYVGELIQAKGVDNCVAEDLIDDVLPYARDRVSDDVKNSLLGLIRESLSNSVNKIE